MKSLPFLLAVLAVHLVLAFGQIVSYAPSEGRGVSYSLNVPDSTASSGSGPIYMQMKGPADCKWIGLGQGSRMTSGNLFIVYSADAENVTLSPRTADGHTGALYNPNIHAYLLDGSGIADGSMTANIRCDNCMKLYNGENFMTGSSSSWTWAFTHGEPLATTNVSHKLYQHDWHGIFSWGMKSAIGGDSENPFMTASLADIDITTGSTDAQISDTLLHRKRISHGVMTSVAFVLLFPHFALLLYVVPSRRTVAMIHAPFQIFALILAISGAVIGVSASRDLQDDPGYHPIIGYVALIGVVLFQPVLGIIQHLRFRKSGAKTLYGVAHRWLGRFLSVLGIINGGLGFSYAVKKNPDIPPASPIAYGIISAGVGVIYISILVWKRYWPQRKLRKSAQAVFPETKNMSDADSASTSRSTLCEKPAVTVPKAEA